MVYLGSAIVVLALMAGAIGIIWSTLNRHAESIVAALAGRSIRAAAFEPMPRVVRVSVRPSVRRSMPSRPLRAAA